MNTDNDFELVNKFIAGDETAFNLLAKKYQKRIYWHARQMLNNHLDADEVTQEVLIVMYKKLSSFNFKSSLFTWIYKIAATRSLNYLKRNKIKKFFSFDNFNEAEFKTNNDIINDIANKDKIKRINKVLEKIPPKQRQVFVFRNYDELSYEEISEITGVSVGGLKANYFHALKKIMEQINEND